jgi:hypothetical protein
MTQAKAILAVAVVAVLSIATAAGVLLYRRVTGVDRPDRDTPEQVRQRIVSLDAERAQLRSRLDALAGGVAGLADGPDTPVRVAVPTSLVRDLVERVVREVADRVTVRVGDVRVRRTGTVRRGITLGAYDLRVTVNRVTATLEAGTPRLTFGGNRIAATLPLTLASGTGRATVDFAWDGRNVAGAVCGDMTVTETVTGTVKPRTYPVSGALHLEMTDTGIMVRPRLPRLTIHIDVEPSAAAWAAVQQVLDSKRGLCGFVIDRVDILGAVRRVIEKGFDVRLPTERARPFAVPVSVEPTLMVRGAPVAIGIRLDDLKVTEDAFWIGAHVSMAPRVSAAAPLPPPRPPATGNAGR